SGADEYDAKFKVLTENVEHHVEEEEGELFPNAQNALGTTALNYLGSEMEARQKELRASSTGVVSETLQQAKDLVSKTFDALTAPVSPSGPKRKRSTPRTLSTRKAGLHRRTSARELKGDKRHARGRKKHVRATARTAAKKAMGSTRSGKAARQSRRGRLGSRTR